VAQDWFSANAPKAQPAAGGDWFAANAPKAKKSETKQEPQRHPNAKVADAVGNTVKGAWNVVSAIPGAMLDMAKDVAPYDEQGNAKFPMQNTVKGIWDASGRVMQGSADAFREGDYLTGVRKAINTVPVVGPMLDASADKMMQGDIAEGVGEVVTNAALTLGPFAPKNPKTKPPILKKTTNPKDAAAVDFARQQGVPLDAGTVTGSNFIKTAQEKAGNSYGGARTAENLKGQQSDALARVGQELTDAAAPTATNPLAAGESIRQALTSEIQNQHGLANTAYGRVRQGSQGASIDLTGFKQQVAPVYQRLFDENALVPLQGAKAKALVALDRIMKGPDAAPFGEVDAALGDLKSMSRGADMPELRNQGQGIASFAVQKLDAQVRAAAAKAGPDVLKALEEGRAATKQKYATAEVLDMLSGEPGQIYRQLTQAKDVGLERLKAVEKLAPKEMPNIGRAFLEDMMQQATAEGGFAHADRLWANWQKLGGETKKKLFPKPGQIQALDNFFLLGKRIGEIKNPSGTAKVAGVLDLATGIPAWALSRMLLTPQGVKYLTEARVVNKSPSPAARAVAITNITKAAQSAGVPLEAIPALGGTDPQATRPGRPQ